jgi:hypothetical protein
MDSFVQLTADARVRLCNEAQARLGLPAASIEKDFWVCWTLRELFRAHGWDQHLVFKGGTSLSKAWKLIERFSEDIDIVIDRAFLGFSGTLGPEHAPSRKQQRQRLDALKVACQDRIRKSLLPILASQFGAALGHETTWKIEEDEADPDRQSLLFFYPSFVAAAAYVRPVVKIELGARSDTEPTETPDIQPYVAEVFPDLLGPCSFPVRVVAARRTFWEKAMLLHEETYRPGDKPRKSRLARHYYDLWSLIQKGVGEQAIDDAGLFERVAAHRQIFFRWSWMDYATLAHGKLRLVPSDDQVNEWRQDYRTMQAEMIFGEAPAFEEILRVVGEFEARFNGNPA